MQPAKFLVSVVVLFIWGYLYETFLSPTISGSAMSSIPGLVNEPPMQWLIVGALVATAVFVWFYERVRGSFGAGARGGMMYGLSVGILMNFPMWLYFSLFVAWPYKAMWHFTLMGIVMATINGAIVGLVYEKVGNRS